MNGARGSEEKDGRFGFDVAVIWLTFGGELGVGMTSCAGRARRPVLLAGMGAFVREVCG
jgi:hypothetical protein